jgi:hypothetical protein
VPARSPAGTVADRPDHGRIVGDAAPAYLYLDGPESRAYGFLQLLTVADRINDAEAVVGGHWRGPPVQEFRDGAAVITPERIPEGHARPGQSHADRALAVASARTYDR